MQKHTSQITSTLQFAQHTSTTPAQGPVQKGVMGNAPAPHVNRQTRLKTLNTINDPSEVYRAWLNSSYDLGSNTETVNKLSLPTNQISNISTYSSKSISASCLCGSSGVITSTSSLSETSAPYNVFILNLRSQKWNNLTYSVNKILAQTFKLFESLPLEHRKLNWRLVTRECHHLLNLSVGGLSFHVCVSSFSSTLFYCDVLVRVISSPLSTCLMTANLQFQTKDGKNFETKQKVFWQFIGLFYDENSPDTWSGMSSSSLATGISLILFNPSKCLLFCNSKSYYLNNMHSSGIFFHLVALVETKSMAEIFIFFFQC